MLTAEQLERWARDGYMLLRGFVEPAVGEAMAAEAIAAIRADPPSAHVGEPAYALTNGMMVQPEARVPPFWFAIRWNTRS